MSRCCRAGELFAHWLFSGRFADQAFDRAMASAAARAGARAAADLLHAARAFLDHIEHLVVVYAAAVADDHRDQLNLIIIFFLASGLSQFIEFIEVLYSRLQSESQHA